MDGGKVVSGQLDPVSGHPVNENVIHFITAQHRVNE